MALVHMICAPDNIGHALVAGGAGEARDVLW